MQTLRVQKRIAGALDWYPALVKVRASTKQLRRALASAGVGMVLMFPGPLDKADVPAPQATPPPLPSSAFSASDRTYKIDLIDKLPKPPQLLVFGGSRATRFDPAYIQKVTGLRAFNAAFANGRPTDDWAITRYLLSEHPTLKLQVFWAVESSLFFDKYIDPGLVQDPRLAAAFDQATVDEAAQAQIVYMQTGPPKLWYPGAYASNGQMVHNWYDELAAQGRTVDQGVREWAYMTKASIPEHPHHRTDWSLNKRCFVATISLLNSIGVKPIIVAMPTHPLGIEILGKDWWMAQRMRFMMGLRSLQRRYQFAVLDYSTIASFGGDPNAFYDGVHIMQENADRIIDAAWRDYPWLFELPR